MFKLSATLLSSAMAFAASIALASTPAAQQKHFSTPDMAVEALIAAYRENSAPRILAILGVEATPLIHSGDPVADRRSRSRFVEAFDETHKIEFNGQDKAVVIVGKQEWPLPIPLIDEANGWRFDTEAGKEEILNRRVGRNELKVIEVCREYVQAQREYAALEAGGQREFARHFKSSPGQHDGLYWPVKSGETESPFGPLVTEARARGYKEHADSATRAVSHPFYGYYFRILTAQGAHAAGGAKNYLVDGRMTEGFALIAYPATYGDSGVMTFIINQNGIVFEKNLGPKTSASAQELTEYDPDSSWRAVGSGA
jgi:hypothetical protein